MKLIYLACLFGLFLYPFSSESAWNVPVEYESTSDNVIRQSIQLKYSSKLQNILWPYAEDMQVSEEHFGAIGQYNKMRYGPSDYEGGSFAFLYGKRLSQSTHATVELGAHTFKGHELARDKNIAQYSGKIDWIMNEQWQWSGEYKHDFLYSEMLTGSVISQGLSADSLTVRFLLMPSESIRIPFSIRERAFEDNNLKTDSSFDVKYALDRKENWIWAGAGLAYSSAKERRGYWSPNSSLTFGPRFEFAISSKERWQWAGEVSYNYTREDGQYLQGTNYNLSVTHGERHLQYLKLTLYQIDSTQLGSGWKSQGINLETQF